MTVDLTHSSALLLLLYSTAWYNIWRDFDSFEHHRQAAQLHISHAIIPQQYRETFTSYCCCCVLSLYGHVA